MAIVSKDILGKEGQCHVCGRKEEELERLGVPYNPANTICKECYMGNQPKVFEPKPQPVVAKQVAKIDTTVLKDKLEIVLLDQGFDPSEEPFTTLFAEMKKNIVEQTESLRG